MLNINLACLNNHKKDTEDLKREERKYNHKYQDIVYDYISENDKCCSDGCGSCGHSANKEDYTYLEGKIIIESESQGMLGHHFCYMDNDSEISLELGDLILVEDEQKGTEITEVIGKGDLFKLRQHKTDNSNEKPPKIIRKLTEDDYFRYQKNLQDEENARPFFTSKVEKFELNMKLVRIHYQFDRKKLFFFYTSDGRVDFRELAKELAGQYRTRIELRQIGVRDEAKLIGGLATCGREYCCASFLNGFKRITTQLANDQNLSSSMSKLSGPCGKLKCCLSYEHESDEVIDVNKIAGAELE